MAAGQGSGRYTSRELPSQPELFEMNTTPRGTNESVGTHSPDRLLLAPGAEEIWDEEQATHTEGTAEEEDRHVRLAAKLAGLDEADEFSVEFMIRCDQVVGQYKELYEAWVDVDSSRALLPKSEFYRQRLYQVDPDRFANEYELKMHVYALGV